LPRSFGRFRLLREIGRGARGIVYQSMDARDGKTVALKAMIPQKPPGTPEAAADTKAYILAARLNASLPRHPSLVEVYEADEIDGRGYFTMELIQGQPISTWERQERVTLRDRIALVRAVALALDEAHRTGFLHSNIKPTNVLVDGKDVPHLTDFRPDSTTKLESGLSSTALGLSRGVLTYLSPEQLMNQKHIDRRSDVYALGVMLFVALTGRPPFKAESTVKTLICVMNEPAPRPSSCVEAPGAPAIDGKMDAIVLRALSKDPAQRHPSAQAVADELAKWLG
ncbi:MAG TPA: serine/threonine-protein kinase, partial [Planctomycetota bacterium]|nr:serine/threonine-protein kinase [Planctomycetota bacterium]